MRKSTTVALSAVALVSIAVRLSPLWSFLYWGSDTGEYFSILRALVRSGHLSTTYYGWGVTYPFFPGMFFAQAGFVDLGGLDVPTTINLLVPILGALAVLPSPWRWPAGAKREVMFASALLGGTFVYWLGYATTFRESILPDVNIQPWWALLALFPAGLILLGGIIFARSRVAWRYRTTYPALHRPATAYLAAVGSIFVIGVVSVVIGVPGTTFRVPATGLLYFVPLVLLLSFAAAGRRFVDFLADGLAVNGWFVALLGSAVVGIAVAPRVLIPYRHAEYLMIPLAIFAGIGFFRLLDLAGLRGGKRTFALGLCGVLLAANAVAGIPPPSTLAGWREGTIPAALDPAYWARDHASGLVVSDHQGSTTVFGFGGVNATWDRTRDPFLPEFANVPCAGLSDIVSPSGVKNGTYIWIDRDMEAGVRLTPWETAAPMDPAVIAKFDEAPFIKVFDNGYARLYWIGWGSAPTC